MQSIEYITVSVAGGGGAPVLFLEVFILQGLHWVLFVSGANKGVARVHLARIDVFLRRSVDSIGLAKWRLGSAHSKGFRCATEGAITRPPQFNGRR